jgi:predicted ATPase/Tfp pilus assembly protein PilF
MPELTINFKSLPKEYQEVIQLAQDTYSITIAPLQLLVGGWSGAVVYLVSVSFQETGRVEHCILKLDRKGKAAKSDEVTRHNTVMSKSTSDFARQHIAELVFDRVEQEGVIAIFYRIAGQSLLNYRPLSSYGQPSQLQTIFARTNTILLDAWNANASFQQAVHPQDVLKTWLGFRLDAGGNIEHFLQSTCHIDPNIAGVLISGNVFPNPLRYGRAPEPWYKARPIDIATGLIHGDLNTNNILVKFSGNAADLEGYYLIDFALFKDQMPLLYDQRYLEMSYLIHCVSQVSFAKFVSLIMSMAEGDVDDLQRVPVEMSGISAVIASGRNAFAKWVTEKHSSLHDDLWAQYWLAGVAAGLSFCHKAGQPDQQRLAGLIYAAANLKRYLTVFNLPLPNAVEFLYDENQSDTDVVAAAGVKKSKHNLPAQTTPFIGRTAQITAIRELVLNPDTHLVTLIGPGGTGKTRLSLRVAEELLDNFPNGICFVSLGDDTNTSQFISRVAQQLDIREGGRPLLESIKDYLRDKRMLLILDNFEQLIASAPVVADLMAAAPQLKILISSRIALNLRGERVVPVPPLELPQTEEDLTVDNLAENEAILLFLGRAQAVQPSFTLTHDNAPAIAEICRRLDGLPLALELAAARVKLLTPQAILNRLDDRLKLLTGGARDLPTRQQTLRNTLEWSYSLLSQEEKTLYARLSVFVGGFTLETAEAICNTDGNLDILEGLSSLLNNSLLRQEKTADGEPRFSMLETIRVYALERLAASNEMETLREQHAKHFGNRIINEISFQLFGGNSLNALNWLERENDNVRATLHWSALEPQRVEFGARLLLALFWFWYRRGYFIEGRTWSDKLLASPAMQEASLRRAWALLCGGMMALWKGEQQAALTQLQESLEIELKFEDEQWIPIAIMANAVAMINMGRDSAARSFLEQARSLFKEQNQTPFVALTLVHLGNVELGLGNPEQARELHEWALTIARSVGDSWLVTFALNNLGEVARTQGQYDLARKYYEECQLLLHDTGDTGDLARFVHNLGYIAEHEGDYALAESQFRQSLSMFRRVGNRRGIAECLAGLAGLKARQGDPQAGAALLSAGESLLFSTGGAWWPADRVEVERNRELIQSVLRGDEFTNVWERGKTMTIDQAIAFASDEP